MKVIQSDCDASIAQDRTLPNNAFLIEYIEGDLTKFDLVMSSKQVEIFDHYYDKYKKDLINITQSEGRVNPKLWGIEVKEKRRK
tara:strand:+ start:798 stop:1049 length:252 start_codon:yes stop_codon:yes gene_type:complete